MSTITINTGAAVEDAKQVDSIVASMEEDMKTLDRAINNTLADHADEPGIYTDWSTKLKENWKQYCASDLPTAFGDMKLSATNLRLAVDEALKYSTESGGR